MCSKEKYCVHSRPGDLISKYSKLEECEDISELGSVSLFQVLMALHTPQDGRRRQMFHTHVADVFRAGHHRNFTFQVTWNQNLVPSQL